MGNFLQKLFGPNWHVRVYGYIAVLSTAIVADPNLISFFPVAWQAPMVGFAKLVAVVSGALTIQNVKGSQVTGGSVPVTHEAAVRVQEENKIITKTIEDKIFPAEVISEGDYDRIPRAVASLKE